MRSCPDTDIDPVSLAIYLDNFFPSSVAHSQFG